MKRILWALLIGAALLLTAQTAKVLTNADVVDMVNGKLSDSVIIAEIHKSACKFSTEPTDLIALKKAGVSDAVLEAMTSAGNPASAPDSATAATASATPAAAPGLPHEIGVYYKKGDDWLDLPPEVVNWKTGGVLKSMGTAGIVKGDINGNIRGEHAPTNITTPLEFLVIVPEGGYITEYQLIHLRGHKDGREFRTVTGGVFHVSGGATRDVLPFKSDKIADRTFRVQLQGLTGGEYGFLPRAQL